MRVPKRVRMTRQHPWRADNPNAVIVARPGKWGNPYRVVRTDAVLPWRVVGPDGSVWGKFADKDRATEYAVELFRKEAADLDLSELTGRDLTCWCPLDWPCHGDVLLELANPHEYADEYGGCVRCAALPGDGPCLAHD